MSRQSGNSAYVRVLADEDTDCPMENIDLVLLNKGGDDQMECMGYRSAACRRLALVVLVVLTLGLVLLIFYWRPDWWVSLLKTRCPLIYADTVVLKDAYGNLYPEPVKTMDVQGLSSYGSIRRPSINEDHVSNGYDGAAHCEESDTTGLTQRQQQQRVRYFDYRHVRYVWSNKHGAFTKLHGLDGELTCAEIHDHWANGLSAPDYTYRAQLYGDNAIDVPVKSYFRLLIEEVLNPFYIFQICSMILWCLDDYYVYATCILIISCISIGIELYETRKQRATLRDMVGSQQARVIVIRAGLEAEVETASLVPGDVLVVPEKGCMMSVDAVLLSGNAIVNESMLTGESVPVTKTPLCPSEAEEVFSHEGHKRHILFCGTKVIQTRYYSDTNVKAVVVRTGFSTAKGELVCSILYPKPIGFKFYQDSIRFIMMLGGLAVIGMGYSIAQLLHNKTHIYKIVLRVLDIITIIVPPALPAAMTVGTVYAQNRLKKQGIFCISPPRINVCGKIKLVCFDKTGTLTEDGLDLWGIVPLQNNRFLRAVEDPSVMPTKSSLVVAMATCHSLTNIDGELTGDPLDLKMFNATQWILEEPGKDTSRFDKLVPTIVRPTTRESYYCHNEPQKDKLSFTCDCCQMPYEVGIVRQFPFSSSLQRMAVITRVLGARNMECYCKGAPEKVQALCRPDTVPDDFHEVLKNYTQRGFRVIALAWRPLDSKLTWHQAQRIHRDAVEGNLIFLGLLVLENMLKPQTTPVIHTLMKARIRTVMVTGDNMLTAVSVARQCGMVGPKEAVVMVTAHPPDGDKPAQVEWEFADSDNTSGTESESVTETEGSELYQSLNIEEVRLEKYHFAINGKSFGVIRHYFPELISKIVVRGTVFARMSPEQKTQLVESLQDLGYCVGMCGDGANDCGALKTAHAGISLSEAEASVASPFTSRTANIECVPTVIREGRAALVTSFGVFKYMALYSIVQFVSVLILYSYNTNLSDWMFLYIDLVITTTVAIFMGHTGAYGKLSQRRPPGSLMSPANIFTLLLHILLVTLGQAGAILYLGTQPWYTPLVPSADAEAVKSYEGNVIFLVSAFQYLLLAFCFSKGPPYRKPIWTNVPFLLALVVLTGCTVLLLIHPFTFLAQLLLMQLFPNGVLIFQLTLLGIVGIHFVLAIFIEGFVADSRILKRAANAIRRKHTPKNKYKLVEQELRETPSWPPIGQVIMAESSPLYKANQISDTMDHPGTGHDR